LRIAEGGHIGRTDETGIPAQAAISLNGHALQCRITTENPENNFIPDYGRISAYRGAFGFGIRVDGANAYSGAVVTRYYDPMLEKVIAWASTPEETVARMLRALREYRIRGVATNLVFLQGLLDHPRFRANDYTTRFVDDTPELFQFAKPRDRATKLLRYIADVTVNGHPDVKGRARPPATARPPVPPHFKPLSGDMAASGSKPLLDRIGPEKFAAWMRETQRTLVTDTTMRDAHQSLLATRLRSFDLLAVAQAYRNGLPGLLSLECWGGATFDVSMRFLSEDPWERLTAIREKVPNILLQMLLRGANGVGYTNYPDNVVRFFVRQAASAGIDIFRIFDCLNWIENMRMSIDAVGEAGKLIEGSICYTGDILDPDRAKYSLRYYVDLARSLEQAGCHILGLKDMAGVLKPPAARILVKALKDEIGLPIHLHTHDTAGIGAATVLAAVEAGADAVDLAMDAMSGLTSQPCFGAVVQALRHTAHDTGIDPEAVRRISSYYDAVRMQYAAFESDMKAGASEIYLHEMPGGQFTNLKEQARSLGLDKRWHDVAAAYRAANDIFGDIVKVTPSSKVVGDMALMMVSQGLTAADVVDPARDIVFPASVVEMMRGDLGQPRDGWPAAIQKKVLKDIQPITVRPGTLLAEADLAKARADAERDCGRAISDQEFAAWLMYPKLFVDFARASEDYGPVTVLPTPVFFYGMQTGEEIAIEIERGKTLLIRLLAVGETDEEGTVRVFFELNGQTRIARVQNRAAAVKVAARPKADDGNAAHIGAPMPGSVSTVEVQAGATVKAGDVLATLEAMKMETIVHAPRAGTVTDILVSPGQQVDTKDLMFVIT
jgi:pyruvate carboxylase